MAKDVQSPRTRNTDLEKQLSYNGSRMNSTGSRYTPIGSDKNYARDIDRLYVMYKPLRLAVYKEVSSWLTSEQDKADLTSFINEHFVRLVKEYDPTSNVDFPGYIKKMLTLRAKHSFTSNLRRYSTKEDTVGTQEDMLEYLSVDSSSDVGEPEEAVYDYFHRFQEYVEEQVGLTPLQRDALKLLLTEHSTKYVNTYLADKYDEDYREVSKVVALFKETLRPLIDSFNQGN